MERVLQALNGIPLAGVMLVVAAGFLIGRLQWRGLSLGPAGGTVAIALFLGNAGLAVDHFYGDGDGDATVTAGSIGFALFIYSVGFEAGARFFATLRSPRGWRMVAIGTLVNVIAIAAAIGCARAFSLDASTAAGLLAGALTSAPTFAAVSEVCDDAAALSIAFAVTYPFGLVGLVLMIQALPIVFGQNLAAEVDDDSSVSATSRHRFREPEVERAFRVTRAQALERTLAELDLTHRTGCMITRIHRGDAILVPEGTTILEAGDHVLARGHVDELHQFEDWVGPEVYDEDLRQSLADPRRVHVESSDAVGRSLAELDLVRRFHCLIAAVHRGEETLEPTAELTLQRHDVVDVVGPRKSVAAVAASLGRFEPSATETDIAIYAAGILFGLLVGNLGMTVGGVELGLGTAGGLLVAGLLLGRSSRIGPFRVYVPLPARQLVRDFGILLFVSETGIRAGNHLETALGIGVWKTVAAGAFVTVVPIALSVIAGRWMFRLPAVDTWGSVAGGTTSSAALLALRRATDSDAPAVSYATAYAIASVLVTMAGHVVVFALG